VKRRHRAPPFHRARARFDRSQTFIGASRCENATRIGFGDSRKKPVLASGDETRWLFA